jgi:hypothetical protein
MVDLCGGGQVDHFAGYFLRFTSFDMELYNYGNEFTLGMCAKGKGGRGLI